MQANVFQAAGLPIDRHIPTSLSVWVGLNVLDALLTLFLLGAGGVGGNPMLSAMQSEIGAVGMLFSKIGIAAIAGVALLTINRAPLLVLASKLMAIVGLYNVAAYVLAPGATMPFIN